MFSKMILLKCYAVKLQKHGRHEQFYLILNYVMSAYLGELMSY